TDLMSPDRYACAFRCRPNCNAGLSPTSSRYITTSLHPVYESNASHLQGTHLTHRDTPNHVHETMPPASQMIYRDRPIVPPPRQGLHRRCTIPRRAFARDLRMED